MDDYNAIPQLAESMETMLEGIKAKLAVVVQSRPGVVDVRLSDGTVSTYATAFSNLPVDKQGVVIVGRGRNGIFIPFDMMSVAGISDIPGLQDALDGKVPMSMQGRLAQVSDNVSVTVPNVNSIIFDAANGFVVTSGGSTYAVIRLNWGSSSNQVPRGNHTHPKSQNAIYTYNNSGSGNVLKADWVDGFYCGELGGIEAFPSSWNAQQINFSVRWGGGVNQVPRGNHNHNPRVATTNDASVWAASHTTNTSTVPRTQPTTDAYALPSVASGQGVTRMGTLVSITSNGIVWWQCHHYQCGVQWFNSAHLTAV